MTRTQGGNLVTPSEWNEGKSPSHPSVSTLSSASACDQGQYELFREHCDRHKVKETTPVSASIALEAWYSPSAIGEPRVATPHIRRCKGTEPPSEGEPDRSKLRAARRIRERWLS